ncbi:MAG: hypothetical protein WAU11_12425 [Ignavibacteriaceae bacterium]
MKNILPLAIYFVVATITFVILSVQGKEYVSPHSTQQINFSIDDTSFYEEMYPEKIGIKIDSIIYQDFKILKEFDIIDTDYNMYYFVILKNGIQIYHSELGVENPKYLSMELKDILHKNNKQLILNFYSGGAHCCDTYMVFDLLKDSLHLIYYDGNYLDEVEGFQTIDLDGDKVCEITTGTANFDYFDRLCHADSPSGRVVFKYSKRERRYIISNKSFPTYILKDIENYKKEFNIYLESVKLKNHEYNSYILKYTLSILIDYIYAGKEDEGWQYFNKYYILEDKLTMIKKIEEVFSESKVYKEIYN